MNTPKPIRSSSSTGSPSLQGRSVCIIEDDPVQVMILQAMLANAGAELEIYHSGEEAQSRLMSAPVDIILSDVMMPGMDGWELHARVREKGPNKDTPLIFTTCVINRDQEALMSDLRNRTLSLAKPFTKQRLLKSMERLLESVGSR